MNLRNVRNEGVSPSVVADEATTVEEGVVAKVARAPVRPTEEEVEIHNATHVPFRSWCPFCVAGKAKVNSHLQKDVDRPSDVPVISLDYAFLGDGDKAEAGHDEVEAAEGAADTESESLKVLVLHDREYKYITSTVVPRKGDHPWAIHSVGEDVSLLLGRKRAVFKSDQEPSMKRLKAAVRREFSVDLAEELSAVGESQSNGEVENAIQRVEGQVRTLKCQLEHRLGVVLESDSPILPWLIRHAGALISRYQIGADGMTAYRRLRGRNYDKVMIEFGECIWYIKNKSDRANKLNSRWAVGVYLGSSEMSNELYVGTNEGVIKVRSFRRKGSSEERWNKEHVLAVTGTPWEPIPGVKSYEIKSRIDIPVERVEFDVEAQSRSFVRRRFRIARSDIETHGGTVGCRACDNTRAGLRAGNHSEECRSRFEEIFLQHEDPRIHREVDRVLADQVDEAELPDPDVVVEETERSERAMSTDDNQIGVTQEDGSVFYTLYELTADVSKALKFVSWDRKVRRQWLNQYGVSRKWNDGVKSMCDVLSTDLDSHVSEVYSPPRVTGLAPEMGLLPGYALDLSVCDPDDGRPWDFNDPEKRKKALALVFTRRSLLLIGSPMCSAFSNIQNLNWGRMSEEDSARIKEYGLRHLKFACKLYELQRELQLYFLHEHPASATSWKEPCVTRLLNKPGVEKVTSDMCVYGMKQEDDEGEALIKKPTSFMTNAPAIARRLSQRCTGGHRHITLMGGRSKRAEVYPQQLCREILYGLIEQAKHDGRMMGDGCVGLIASFDEHNPEYKEQLASYWDDITGKELNPEKVVLARAEEMKEFAKHNVYTKVPLAQCWARTNKRPIGVRWVDINKGDDKNPKYRSRLVAKELKLDKRDDLFAATPPLEAKKLLVSLAMTDGLGKLKLDFIDVRRAFFHAECRREVYVELPPEDASPGMCGKLNMAMYGTRDAPQNWEFEYGEFMESVGFKKGKSTPCLFYHEPRNLRCVVYGDDFTVLGPEEALDWFRKQMLTRYEVEFKARLGGTATDDTAVFLLNRPIEWIGDCITYEADQRHVEIISRDLGMGDKIRSTPFPYERPSAEEIAREPVELAGSEATMYRAMVARANYLSQDRSDIRYAVKELSRSMSKPTEADWSRVKRLGRYLANHPRLIQKFKRQHKVTYLDVWVDTDFAGCLRTRKSTNGGVITMGSHVIKTWSSTQTVIALSSGEAEYYGMVKGASVALGIKSMLQDLGYSIKIRLRTDASAAKGIASRRGLGKIRHIEVQQLWLQEKVNNGDIEVVKVKGEGNLADALTKPLDGPGTKKHLELTGQEVISGRHTLTPDFEAANQHAVDEVTRHTCFCTSMHRDLSKSAAGSSALELLSLDATCPGDSLQGNMGEQRPRLNLMFSPQRPSDATRDLTGRPTGEDPWRRPNWEVWGTEADEFVPPYDTVPIWDWSKASARSAGEQLTSYHFQPASHTQFDTIAPLAQFAVASRKDIPDLMNNMLRETLCGKYIPSHQRVVAEEVPDTYLRGFFGYLSDRYPQGLDRVPSERFAQEIVGRLSEPRFRALYEDLRQKRLLIPVTAPGDIPDFLEDHLQASWADGRVRVDSGDYRRMHDVTYMCYRELREKIDNVLSAQIAALQLHRENAHVLQGEINNWFTLRFAGLMNEFDAVKADLGNYLSLWDIRLASDIDWTSSASSCLRVLQDSERPWSDVVAKFGKVAFDIPEQVAEQHPLSNDISRSAVGAEILPEGTVYYEAFNYALRMYESYGGADYSELKRGMRNPQSSPSKRLRSTLTGQPLEVTYRTPGDTSYSSDLEDLPVHNSGSPRMDTDMSEIAAIIAQDELEAGDSVSMISGSEVVNPEVIVQNAERTENSPKPAGSVPQDTGPTLNEDPPGLAPMTPGVGSASPITVAASPPPRTSTELRAGVTPEIVGVSRPIPPPTFRLTVDPDTSVQPMLRATHGSGSSSSGLNSSGPGPRAPVPTSGPTEPMGSGYSWMPKTFARPPGMPPMMPDPSAVDGAQAKTTHGPVVLPKSIDSAKGNPNWGAYHRDVRTRVPDIPPQPTRPIPVPDSPVAGLEALPPTPRFRGAGPTESVMGESVVHAAGAQDVGPIPVPQSYVSTKPDMQNSYGVIHWKKNKWGGRQFVLGAGTNVSHSLNNERYRGADFTFMNQKEIPVKNANDRKRCLKASAPITCGVAHWDLESLAVNDLRPTSITTIHIYGLHFPVAIADVMLSIEVGAQKFGLTPQLIEVQRYKWDGSSSIKRGGTLFESTDPELAAQYCVEKGEPTGHIYVRFAPGKPYALMCLICWLDQTQYVLDRTRAGVSVMSRPLTCQLSHREMALPLEPLKVPRNLCFGVKLWEEVRNTRYFTDFDYYPWKVHRGHTNPGMSLFSGREFREVIINGWEGLVGEITDHVEAVHDYGKSPTVPKQSYKTEFESRARELSKEVRGVVDELGKPLYLPGVTFVDLPTDKYWHGSRGRSYRQRTFGGGKRKVPRSWADGTRANECVYLDSEWLQVDLNTALRDFLVWYPEDQWDIPVSEFVQRNASTLNHNMHVPYLMTANKSLDGVTYQGCAYFRDTVDLLPQKFWVNALSIKPTIAAELRALEATGAMSDELTRGLVQGEVTYGHAEDDELV